jgi:hypothetical protein
MDESTFELACLPARGYHHFDYSLAEPSVYEICSNLSRSPLVIMNESTFELACLPAWDYHHFDYSLAEPSVYKICSNLSQLPRIDMDGFFSEYVTRRSIAMCFWSSRKY